MPSNIDLLIDSIDLHIGHGRRIFPLRPGTKHALEAGYQTRTYTKAQLIGYLRSGQSNGLGWCLGPRDLIFDIDPRHAGAVESMGDLDQRYWGGCLGYRTPTVLSGGADHGRHHYMKLPSDCKRLRMKMEKYPGLEVKYNNLVVVLPYSIHPVTKNPYQWDPLSPYTESPLIVPDELVEQLSVKPRSSHGSHAYDPITPEQLATLLSYLPVEEYSDHDDWLKIAMAAHHATAGEGVEEFVEWSVGDPTYWEDAERIRRRWESFDAHCEDGVTLRTLNLEVAKRGGKPIDTVQTLALQALTAIPETTEPEDLFTAANKMDPNTPGEDIERLIRAALDAGPMMWSRVRRALIKSLGISAGEIGDYVSRLKLQIRDEARKKPVAGTKALAVIVADHLLASRFDDTKLIHAINQQFYQYIGTHWKELAPNMLTRYLFEAAESLYCEHPKLETKVVSTLDHAAKALVARTATDQDVFGFTQDPLPVINTLSGEVWLSQDGQAELRGHKPDSYLLTCLPVEYDASAMCPELDRALLEIFGPSELPAEMVRHLWEIIGYICQPRKNIPAYFVFFGGGANGKSLIGRVISALVGKDNVIPRALTDFLGSGDTHATSSLPGKLLLLDDDSDPNLPWPESALKKLAENKEMEANPKYRAPYVFRTSASPLILINGLPRIKDLSYGMLRRAYLVPFQRRFTPDQADLSLGDRILANEIPGALNRAIDGYRRLRQRGTFDQPADCRVAFDQWLESTNPLVGFVSQSCSISQETVSQIDELYRAYRDWCGLTGVRFPVQQNSFESSLGQLGYQVETINGSRYLNGIGLRGMQVQEY